MPKVTDEHRQQRRDQIILAAMTCVAAEGFHKTTMADVIQASGLSAGAVYGYFRSKDELILAIADRALGSLDMTMTELLTRDPVPSPAETLEHLTTLVVTLAEQGEVDLTRVAVAAWAEAARDEQVRSAVADRIRQVRVTFAQVIRAQQDAGHVDPAADPDSVAKAMFALMPGFVMQRLITQDVSPEDFAAGFAALLR